MEIPRNTPRQNSLKLTHLLADPGATSLRDVRQAHRKVAASIEFAREECRVTAQFKRTEHSRSDAQARTSQRQSDQRTVVAVLSLSEAQDAAVSWSPRSARKKRSWINPRRHSQMLSNSKKLQYSFV